MRPQTSLRKLPGKINVGTLKINTVQENGICWEKPYSAPLREISPCLAGVAEVSGSLQL